MINPDRNYGFSHMERKMSEPEPKTDKTPEMFPLSKSLELFKAFDRAADLESAAPPPETTEESRARLYSLIWELPQKSALKDKHVQRWLDRTMQTAFDRMELEHGEGNATVKDVHDHVFWHVRRASGIGGSEAGTVLKHYRGKRGTFGDAHNLVLEKLLILSPQPSSEEMARGVRAEPWVQRMYHEQHNVESHPDLKKLKNFRWDRRPASVGTPDDIVVHTQGELAGKKRCLDYKAPSAQVVSDYEENGISLDYRCQVHHYAILQLASGSKFDVMSIEVFDPRSFKIMSFNVDFDLEFAKEIADGCHRLWHENVMMGVVPDAPSTDVLDVKDKALVDLGVQAAFLKVLIEDLTKRQKDLLERITTMGSVWHDSAVGKMELAVAALNRKRSWDEDKLRDIAEAAEVDLTPFEVRNKKGKVDATAAANFFRDLDAAIKEEDREAIDKLINDIAKAGVPIETKLDTDKLAEYLQEHDISVTEAVGVKESFLLSRKTKGPEFERMEHLRHEVSELVDGIEKIAEEHAPKIILGEEDDEDYDPAADMA
jgi:predicted phage-related endonuclease